ncbi:MAG: MaoC family dehydratase N-terminal domain-containing protein [Dehalococcoidia bacterium]
MPQDSLITETMKNAIGVESEPLTYEVEKGHIKRFAEAIGDPNPLYQDEAAARKTRYGGIIASPTFFRAFFPKEPPGDVHKEITLSRVLDGGSDWEFFEPIRPGDSISVTSQFANFDVKQGRRGAMLFIAVDIIYRNQFNQVVATQRQNRILY